MCLNDVCVCVDDDECVCWMFKGVDGLIESLGGSGFESMYVCVDGWDSLLTLP